MNFQIVFFIATMLASVVIGIYVLATKPRSFMRLSFGSLVITLALWGASLVALYLTHLFIFSSLVFMSGALWFVALLFFSYSFPHGGKPPRRFFLCALPALAIFILAPFNVFISGFVVDATGYLQPINNLPFLIPFLCIFLAYIGYSLALVIRNYRLYGGTHRYRAQFRYFFIGIGILIFSIVLFDTILPAMNIYQLNLLGPASAILFFISTSYAILRHELLDIRIVIQRSIIYIVFIGLTVGLYALGLLLLGYVFREITNMAVVLVAGAAMIFGIIFWKPVEERLRKATDHVFFKANYNYADSLHALSRILYTSLSKEDILDHSKIILQDIFKTNDVRFILDPDAISSISDKDQAAGFSTLSRPIVFDDNAVGVLYLGPKRSGDSYTKEDLKLVSTFAFPAAIALGKAKLHETIRQYNTHLEEIVDERTREIKKLQEEQKQTMIDVSHNLQTPLAVIKGELELFADVATDPERIDTVKRSIDRVSSFIRQMLHLARLEQSVYTVELSPIDLGTLLREQVEYFEVMAREQGARIISATEETVLVKGNKRLLEELFTSIITNALKYRNPERNLVIRIGLSAANDSCTVTIEDNGTGISPEDLPEIFNRFYRSPNAAPSTFGTGLGLAIAKKIVERHAGAISAASTPGFGTTFTITLPAITEKSDS